LKETFFLKKVHGLKKKNGKATDHALYYAQFYGLKAVNWANFGLDKATQMVELPYEFYVFDRVTAIDSKNKLKITNGKIEECLILEDYEVDLATKENLAQKKKEKKQRKADERRERE
jgi:hypothetical protein